MKVCPKCGYRDNPIWLNHQYQLHIEYCFLEQFNEAYPNLTMKMRGEITEDDFYYYRVTTRGKPCVYRWLKTLGLQGYHLDYEKGDNLPDPFQKKLWK
jgi:hypothetical protein